MYLQRQKVFTLIAIIFPNVQLKFTKFLLVLSYKFKRVTLFGVVVWCTWGEPFFGFFILEVNFFAILRPAALVYVGDPNPTFFLLTKNWQIWLRVQCGFANILERRSRTSASEILSPKALSNGEVGVNGGHMSKCVHISCVSKLKLFLFVFPIKSTLTCVYVKLTKKGLKHVITLNMWHLVL